MEHNEGAEDEESDAVVGQQHVCRDMLIVNIWNAKEAVVNQMVMAKKPIPDQLMPVFGMIDQLAYVVNLVGNAREQCCTFIQPEDLREIEKERRQN